MGFVQKSNENGQILIYKTRLVVQCFSQKLGITFKETYSLILDAILIFDYSSCKEMFEFTLNGCCHDLIIRLS